MEFPVYGPASYHGSAGLPPILILSVAASGGFGDPAFHDTEENDA